MNSELGGTSREYDKRVAKLERLSQKMVIGGAWDDDVAREIEVIEGQLMRMEEVRCSLQAVVCTAGRFPGKSCSRELYLTVDCTEPCMCVDFYISAVPTWT